MSLLFPLSVTPCDSNSLCSDNVDSIRYWLLKLFYSSMLTVQSCYSKWLIHNSWSCFYWTFSIPVNFLSPFLSVSLSLSDSPWCQLSVFKYMSCYEAKLSHSLCMYTFKGVLSCRSCLQQLNTPLIPFALCCLYYIIHLELLNWN